MMSPAMLFFVVPATAARPRRWVVRGMRLRPARGCADVRLGEVW